MIHLRHWSLALVAAGCASCAHGPLGARTLSNPVDTEIGRFEVLFTPEDAASAQLVAQALLRAAPKLSRWGVLRQPVTVDIVPTHAELEEETGHSGYPWLRAWARYREVILQSPRAWGESANDVRLVDELLAHEVTHCLMYQRSAQPDSWTTKAIPLWFREGMASTTALQGYRRGSLDELQRYLQQNPSIDPIANGDSLVQNHSDVVYAAAHQAFQRLEDRYGVAGVGAVMDAMASGLNFEDAFQRALGLSRTTFERDFRAWVLGGGFRNPRLTRADEPWDTLALTRSSAAL